jgi:fermentation-respiration switch protein FrsA (DUF1100 family)
MFSAFTSMSDMAREVYPFLPGVALLLRHRFENLGKIARVTCPVVIGHGRADSIIPHTMSERLAAAAPAPLRVFLVDGADHNDFFEAGGRQVRDALAALVDAASVRIDGER